MAENVGGIQYTVDADTAAMIKAEAVVNKSIANQVKDFEKADAQVRKYIKTQELMGRTINSMGQVIDKNGDIVEIATRRYRAFSQQADTAFNGINTKATQASQAVRKGFSNNQHIQNFSYQVQDLSVQLNGGVNAMMAISQQLPQMLVGMGAAGGVIGALIAVIAGMSTGLLDTTSNIEKLEKSLEQVQAVITIGAGGVANYTEEMQKLSSVSKVLTNIKLQNALAEQSAALKTNTQAMRDAWEEAGTLFDQTSSGVISEIISDKDQDKLDKLAKQFNSGKISAEEFNAETGKIKNAMAGVDLIDKGITNLGYSSKEAKQQGLDQLVQGLELLSTSAAQNTKSGRELTSTITDLVQKYKEGEMTVEALKEALEGTAPVFDKNADAIKDMTNQFTLSAVRMLEGERAAFKLGLQMQGLDEKQVKAQMSLYDYNKELEKTKDDAEKAEEAIKNVNNSLDAYFDKESQDSTDQDRKATATLTTQVQSIGLTPEEEIQARYDRELELLQQAEEKKIEIEGTYAERRKQLEAERLEAMRALNEENVGFLSEAFSNLDTQIAGTMASVVLGAQDGKSALQSLATTILTQLVGAVIQQGITQAMVSAGFIAQKGAETAAVVGGIGAQTAAATAATATTTAAGVASGAAITAAMAPAAAATSIATAGAAPAAAGGIALSTMGMIIAGLVGATALAGAREFGGPVTNGKSYLVGERGPEIFTPNTAGGITSNKDMMGQSSQPQININNYSGQPVTQNYDEINQIVNIAIGKQITGVRKGTGDLAKAIKSSTTSRNRATAR